MKFTSALFALVFFALVFFSSPVSPHLLTVQGDQLPYWQTFDSWDTFFYDGVCYEQQCSHLRGGFFNPLFQDIKPTGYEARNVWVIAGQTPSNWAGTTTRTPVACGSVVTGPCFDFNTGNTTGKYLYAESSGCFGAAFHVISPTIVFTNTTKSISFKYFFFGSDVPSSTINLAYSTDNSTTWHTITTITATKGTNIAASSTSAWQSYNSGSLDALTGLGTVPVNVEFRWIITTADVSGNDWKSDVGLDNVIITQDGAPPPTAPWIDFNCTAVGTCGPPLETTSGGGIVDVSSGDGDGLTDGDIAGIVVGIVGGAFLLCCCLLLLLLLLLLLISPRKPPTEGGEELN